MSNSNIPNSTNTPTNIKLRHLSKNIPNSKNEIIDFQTSKSDSNVTLKKSNTSNNSKPKIPTSNDWELVKKHYEFAKTRNLENDLLINEKHLIKKRDEIYLKAKNNGITEKSNPKERLKVVSQVVEYLYNNVEPPDTYTKKTDITHFKEVASLAVNYCKKENKTAPITLIISCWFHDIERFIKCTKCSYLPEIVDKYRKQLIHPQTSARVALTILKGSPITQSEKNRIHNIIVQHDKPIDKKIEFLNKIYLNRPGNDILEELQTLMDADAMAFFTKTIKEFVNYKIKKNTSGWIWTRISTNIRRLRPKLRIEAIENINKLVKYDTNLKKNMGYDKHEIDQIMHQVNMIDDQGTTDDQFKPLLSPKSDKLQRMVSSPIIQEIVSNGSKSTNS